MVRRSAYIRSGGSIRGSSPYTTTKRKRRKPYVVPISIGGPKSNLATTRNMGFRGRSGSMTEIMPRGFGMNVSVKPVGTGSSYSYYKSYKKSRRGAKYTKATQAPMYTIYNSGYRVTSTQGQQAIATYGVMTASDLHTLYGNTTAATDGSFIVDSARVRTVFQNQSEATTFLNIYEIVCRRDSVQGPVGAFVNGMTSIGSATSNAYDIGATPFMSPRFTANFRILKKYNVELAQGRSHIHTSMYTVNKRYSDSVFQMDNTDDFQYAGWTRFLLVLGWGTPYNSAATKTNVSTTPVAVDVVQNIAYTYRAITINKASFEVETDFPTFADGQIIDIGSGEADTVTDA